MEFNKKTLLKTIDLTKRFGGLVVMNQLSMSVAEGEVHGLLGPNGAGKSTLIKVLTGVYSKDEGSIHLKGKGEVQIHSPQDAQKNTFFSFISSFL